MKSITLNPLLTLFICTLFFASCDNIEEDVVTPTINTPSFDGLPEEIYTKGKLPAVFYIPTIAEDERIELTSSTGTAELVDGTPFVRYTPDAGTSQVEDILQVNLLDANNEVKASGTVKAVAVTDDDCVNSAFTDHHIISSDSTLVVDILQNDAFCDWEYTGNVAAANYPLTETDGVILAVSSRSAEIKYTPTPGFTGVIEFIYVLCFDFAEGVTDDNKIEPEECGWFYTSLARIEVVE